MDAYTTKTQGWLDERFRKTDEHGVYLAHQPIYGFRTPPCEPGLVERYTITFQILQALARLRFRSLVDIGAAEGYKAALVRKRFGAEVLCCDLSEEAVRRSREIYGIDGRAIDVHALPFPDGAFDVVLCSETLEHVPDYRAATRELVRVARGAVVITVPRESEEQVRRNIAEGQMHGHIHALDVDSFDFVHELGCSVLKRRHNSKLLKIPREMVEARPRGYGERKYPEWVYDAYTVLCPLMEKAFGKRTTAAIVRCDDLLSNLTRTYGGMCVTIVKDPAALRPADDVSEIRMEEILDFAVPPHRPSA
jgi:SAM-dependent methyltransferase